MATVGEAIAATLIAQWNVGTGGTQPDPIQYLVERPERDPNPTVADAIYVWLPLKRIFDPIDVGEVYRNVTYTIRIVCHTKTSSARQLEIENEVDRILNSGTVITGATRQRVLEINDISNRSYSNLPKYISEVMMEVFKAMEVSATAYGTATTTTLTTDELTVNTFMVGGAYIDMEGTIKSSADNKGFYTGADDDVRIYHDGTHTYIVNSTGELRIQNQAASDFIASIRESFIIRDIDDAGAALFSIDSAARTAKIGTATDPLETTLNDLNILDALMLGSANAAWVPCSIIGSTDFSIVRQQAAKFSNTGAGDVTLDLLLPMPTNKGGLKLYLKNFKFGAIDSDVDDFVTTVTIYGLSGSDAPAILDTDTTNHDSVGTKTFSGAVMPASVIDVSAYGSVIVYILGFNTGAFQMDLADFLMECYYAA